MKTLVFLGTSDFAVPSLEALARDDRFKIVAVVTQPDRPVGRHAVLTLPPVKVAAEKLGLPVLQPEKLKDLQSPTACGLPPAALHADCFVVASYGKILPQWFLDIPKQGCVNVHASLLPRWRGASPIQAAIAAGDKTSGITIMQMDELLDHGAIIAQEEEPIHNTDTGGSLHDRLAAHGAQILPNILADYLDGKITPREQEHELATTCKILTRDDGKLDISKTSEELERLVRAYNPWPGTWMEFTATDGRQLRLKVLAARVSPKQDKLPFIPCAGGTTLELVTVQPEGKRPMSGAEYARGLKK